VVYSSTDFPEGALIAKALAAEARLGRDAGVSWAWPTRSWRLLRPPAALTVSAYDPARRLFAAMEQVGTTD